MEVHFTAEQEARIAQLATKAGTDAEQLVKHTQEPALLFCPLCNTRLEGHRCKLVCNLCGYFMSCADYY